MPLLNTDQILKEFKKKKDLNFILRETGDSLSGGYGIDAVIPNVFINSIYQVDIIFYKNVFSPAITYGDIEIARKTIFLEERAKMIKKIISFFH